ncbi:MAG: biosynthetic arginine decarboxylase [Gammaproteobacteria bacterium]|nr:biosynthetic arginine decarboxylase [Gammaproteobacteria bacterium]
MYNIERWGEGYFDIDPQGHVVVQPTRNPADGHLDLYGLAKDAERAGLRFPVLFRFGDILRDRVDGLCAAFAAAMTQNDYAAAFTAVYPIKVNQQRAVVEDILKYGGARVGLEAGSKPELMAVLALAPSNSTIICNGYKDREYIRLALIGQQLGHRVFIVVEKLSELDVILAQADSMQLRPNLGVRIRLASIGAGKWQNTGGEKSKFGLTAAQLLAAIEKLSAAGLLDCFRLLHVHLGSQIANIRDIQRGIQEAGRALAELHNQGINIDVMDVGGGLGVDYEGTRSRNFCSVNYSLKQYANTVVRTLAEICSEQDIKQPELITESGRAMTAHHAVMITNVIDSESITPEEPAPPAKDAPLVLHDLWQELQNHGDRSPREVHQDAKFWMDEAQAKYIHGTLNLRERAEAEKLYYAICMKIQKKLNPANKAHAEILNELNEKLADKCFCNMSVFQSMPDVWAINQVFPIMPLHRLTEQPSRRAVLQDLTCDSDGRIDSYIDMDGTESTLAIHSFEAGQEYLLGFFMLGAYQEILGDIHNLFGDTDSVNVELDGKDGYRFEQAEHGDTAEELLSYVHFNGPELLKRYSDKIATADIDKQTQKKYLRELEEGLRGYTYLEK